MSTAYTPLSSDRNRYAIVRAASRRARHLYAGAQPIAQVPDRKHSRVAIDEITTGQVRFTIVRTANSANG